MNELSHRQKVVVWLVLYEGWKLEVVAKHLGIRTRDVDRAFRSGKKKVNQYIRNQEREREKRQQAILIKAKHEPIRDLVLRQGVYPEKKRKPGRPGKYELKKNYDKVLKPRKKSN